MHPTEQVVLPYTLAVQHFTGNQETHVPLPADYDFLLTNIGVCATPEQTGSLQVGLASGVYALGVEIEPSGSVYVAECPTWQGLLVCPAGGTLYVNAAGFTITASLSGWLLNPPASQILPT